MSTGKRAFSLLVVLLVLAVSTSAMGGEVSGIVQGKVVWRGDVTLKKPVTVAPGATLTIAPGTVVRLLNTEAKISVQGILLVQGTAGARVTFSGPPDWQGIEFFEAPKGSSIEFADFAKAQAAVSSVATPFILRNCSFRACGTAVKLLREASPLIEDCLFADNDMAIDNEMKSGPTIRRNRFRGHKTTAILASHNSTGLIEGNNFEKNKQAIGLLQKYPDRIINNRFTDNEVGIFCNQTQGTPVIQGNSFEKNQIAMVNFSFAYPVVENNSFLSNQTAIRNDQFGSPRVVRNLFRDNQTAIYNYRKSNPVVEQNLLEKNGLALFCDYSSYPKVKNNNFIGNKMAVELGIYQSADWEKKAGSRGIVQKEAAARQSQNPLLAQAPTDFVDIVDVSGNWWGDDTAQLAAAGKDGNVAIFFDRKDKPKVVYEGFGNESYALDRVVHEPWLKTPVKDAGPARVK